MYRLNDEPLNNEVRKAVSELCDIVNDDLMHSSQARKKRNEIIELLKDYKYDFEALNVIQLKFEKVNPKVDEERANKGLRNFYISSKVYFDG